MSPSLSPDWLDEIDLDPARPPVAMGTRSLGDRPWLVTDDQRQAQLALKAELCGSRHDEVFAALPGSGAASRATLRAIRDQGVTLVAGGDLHPLERAGRSIQEDLCLMERRADGWHLAAGSVCFPSRWRLRDKLDRHVSDVHGPVAGYSEQLAPRVDQLFDRLHQPVLRRNWFVHGDASLFQPDRPATEAVVCATDALDLLVVRSERQVLRPIGPPGWLLFSIRIQQAPLKLLVESTDRARALRRYLEHADPGAVAHRGIGADQAVELLAALGS